MPVLPSVECDVGLDVRFLSGVKGTGMRTDCQVRMLIDLQFGSTGKGLFAGYHAKGWEPDCVVTAWGPNSGHTFVDAAGRRFVHTQLANGVVSPKLRWVLLGPGSIINVENLRAEMASCADLLAGKRMVIHPRAVVVTDKHRMLEANELVRIGSTMKGTGAAMVQRLMRQPGVIAGEVLTPDHWQDAPCQVTVDAAAYDAAVMESRRIQIEGAQGFSLSLYHGLYPYVTSRDVTPAQMVADCGLPLNGHYYVIGTMRTFPIRVANRFDEAGNQIGTSGPPYPDQHEIGWENIGVEPELTTVTRLPRRIFTFSWQQFYSAMYHCRADQIFLNFCNYDKELAAEIIDRIDREFGIIVRHTGWGPAETDIRARFHGDHARWDMWA